MAEVSAQQTGISPGKIWLKSYPPGIAAEIGPLPYKSIGEFFDHAVARYSSRPAFTCMGKTLTFADLNAQSARIGAWLQSIGLAKGDRVAVMMPNILQNPVIVYGILRAGFTVVNVNPLYTPRELQHQLYRFRAPRRSSFWKTSRTPCSRWSTRPRSSTSSSRPWATCWA